VNDIPKVSGPSDNTAQTELIDLLRWIKWWLIALTLMVAALWILYIAHYVLAGEATSSTARAATPDSLVTSAMSDPSAARVETIVQGPWGRVEVVPTRIAPDLDLVAHRIPADGKQVVWYFPATSLKSLDTLLLLTGIAKPLRSELMGLATRVGAPPVGFEVRPSRDMVLDLDNEARATLYLALVNHPRNADQRGAFRFCGTSGNEWLAGSDISPQTAQLVAPLIYRRDELLFFADFATVSPMLPSVDERKKLLHALTRESTVTLKLKLAPDSDIDALAAYWGRGGREAVVRNALASAQAAGQVDVDIATLLPPFARERLYTYPPRTPAGATVLHDCHWTALNFFAQTPDDRFGKLNKAFDTFLDDYDQITENLRFGDVVTYSDHRGAVIHSAVYIAADILFTKNGHGSNPWTFTRLSAMDDYYPLANRLLIQYFRPKAF